MQTFVVGPENVLKIDPFLVPTLGDHCKVEIDLLGLIFCITIDHKSANVVPKNSLGECAPRPDRFATLRSEVCRDAEKKQYKGADQDKIMVPVIATQSL